MSKSKSKLQDLYNDAMESDSDDEDYVCKEDPESSDREKDSNESSSRSSSSSSESSNDTIEVDDEDDTKEEEKVNHKMKKVASNSNLVKTQSKENSKISAKNIVICCICLNENSDATDELVECDLCGLYVHEGCYGISDTDSKLSTNSSASTEPWFCNACLLEVKSPQCDLCPLKEGGIFKETEAGRLTHAICALYTPNVAYQDTEKLWPVVLDEIPSVRWGEKMCTLCEDIRYSRTGITIKCDAGLCKNYFHATCAQKYGLLVDPLQQDEMHASDPYFAYCKQHQDRAQINARKQNYLAMISNYNEKKARNEALMNSSNASDRERLFRKLQKAKQIYHENSIKRQRPLSPKSKVPRMITTCPSALKSLFRKAELLGARTDYRIDQQQHSNGSVTFSVDFVNYYFEREKKFPGLYEEYGKLRDLQENMKAHERELKKEYEEKLKQHDDAVKSHDKLERALNSYVYIVENYSKTKKLNINTKIQIKNENDESNSASNSSDRNTTTSSKQLESLDLIQLHSCSVCNQSTNMHLIIDCDTCKNYYHINCLDPPLTTMPKKTKLYGWECSSCARDDSSSEQEQESIDLNTPRTLRACDRREEKKTFNIISKYSNKLSGLFKTEDTKKKKKTAAAAAKSKKRTTSLPNKQKIKKVKKEDTAATVDEPLQNTEATSDKKKSRKRIRSTSSISSAISYYSAAASANSVISVGSPSTSNLNQTAPVISLTKTPRQSKKETIIAKCCICEETTVNNKKTTIKCGECTKAYHIKCLNEPVKQYKGYAWICKTCEPSEEDSDNEDSSASDNKSTKSSNDEQETSDTKRIIKKKRTS